MFGLQLVNHQQSLDMLTCNSVPLQMIEFYLILAACTAVALGVFWRLLLGTIVMLMGGYLGEAGFINVTTGFIIGMLGWLFIIYEIFMGEASKVSAENAPESVKASFNIMRLIVTIGWAIYPIGYFMGYLAGGADAATQTLFITLRMSSTKSPFVWRFGHVQPKSQTRNVVKPEGWHCGV